MLVARRFYIWTGTRPEKVIGQWPRTDGALARQGLSKAAIPLGRGSCTLTSQSRASGFLIGKACVVKKVRGSEES